MGYFGCLSAVGRGYVVRLSELALSSKHENAREKEVRRLREGSLDHMPFVQLIHIPRMSTHSTLTLATRLHVLDHQANEVRKRHKTPQTAKSSG